jgi:hypothetical protein
MPDGIGLDLELAENETAIQLRTRKPGTFDNCPEALLELTARYPAPGRRASERRTNRAGARAA